MKTDRTDTAAVEALADSIAHTFDRDDDGRGWVFDSAQLAEFARRLTATQPGAAVPAGFTIDRIDRQTKRAGRVHGLQVMTPPDEEGFSFACFLDANAHHAAVQLIDAFLALNKPGAAVPEGLVAVPRAMLEQIYGMAREGCDAPSAAHRWCERIDELFHAARPSDEYADWSLGLPGAMSAAAPAPEGSALKLGACGVLPSSSLIDSLKTTEALRTLCHQLNAERRKITAAIDPDSAPSSPAPRPCPDMSKSWPERDYMCECSQCGSQFIGAKRQAVCKACAPAPAAVEAGGLEALAEAVCAIIEEHHPEFVDYMPCARDVARRLASAPQSAGSEQQGDSAARGTEPSVSSEPAPNWCPTCGRRPRDVLGIFCKDRFHAAERDAGKGEGVGDGIQA